MAGKSALTERTTIDVVLRIDSLRRAGVVFWEWWEGAGGSGQKGTDKNSGAIMFDPRWQRRFECDQLIMLGIAAVWLLIGWLCGWLPR